MGYQEGEAIIRCSLVTNSPTYPIPHVHQLWLAPDGTSGNLSNDEQHEDVSIYARDQWIATYIINKTLKCIQIVKYNE